MKILVANDKHASETLEHYDPIVKWLKVTRPCVVDFSAQGWHQFTG